MFWLLEPRWYGVCAVVGLLTYGAGVWQGYRYADRSAQIETLEQTVKTANASIERMRKQAEKDAAAVNAYAQREELANEALTDLQEAIDDLTSKAEALPASDVCRLSPADTASLRALALRASGDRPASTAPALDLRRPSASSAPPRQ